MKEPIINQRITKEIILNRMYGVNTYLHYNPDTGEVRAIAQKVGVYAPAGHKTILWKYANKDEPTFETVKSLIMDKLAANPNCDETDDSVGDAAENEKL